MDDFLDVCDTDSRDEINSEKFGRLSFFNSTTEHLLGNCSLKNPNNNSAQDRKERNERSSIDDVFINRRICSFETDVDEDTDVSLPGDVHLDLKTDAPAKSQSRYISGVRGGTSAESCTIKHWSTLSKDGLLETDLDAIDDALVSTPAVEPSIDQSFKEPVVWNFQGIKLSSFCQNTMDKMDEFYFESNANDDDARIDYVLETDIDCDYFNIDDGLPRKLDDNGRPSNVYVEQDKLASGCFYQDKDLSQSSIASSGLFCDALRISNDQLSIKADVSSLESELGDELCLASKAVARCKRSPNALCFRQTNIDENEESVVNTCCETLGNSDGAFFREMSRAYEDGREMITNCDELKCYENCLKLGDHFQPSNSEDGRRERYRQEPKDNVLKDSFKLDCKELSLPVSEEINLDEEDISIWDPISDNSDFSQPVESSMVKSTSIKNYKSEELLSSTQTRGFSPIRQDIKNSKMKWLRGSKSFEILNSRNKSDGASSSRIRRRALSKEWQIVTFTTREETTLIIKPSQDKKVSEAVNVAGIEQCSENENQIKSSHNYTDGVTNKAGDDPCVYDNQCFVDVRDTEVMFDREACWKDISNSLVEMTQNLQYDSNDVNTAPPKNLNYACETIEEPEPTVLSQCEDSNNWDQWQHMNSQNEFGSGVCTAIEYDEVISDSLCPHLDTAEELEKKFFSVVNQFDEVLNNDCSLIDVDATTESEKEFFSVVNKFEKVLNTDCSPIEVDASTDLEEKKFFNVVNKFDECLNIECSPIGVDDQISEDSKIPTCFEDSQENQELDELIKDLMVMADSTKK